MQEEALKLVLLALEDGSALSRKVLVLFVVQRLEPRFPQASKTSIGHVVQLLYRASCFKVPLLFLYHIQGSFAVWKSMVFECVCVPLKPAKVKGANDRLKQTVLCYLVIVKHQTTFTVSN